MATRDEQAKDLARLVLALKKHETGTAHYNGWARELEPASRPMVRLRVFPAEDWHQTQELARQLLDEPD